MITRSLMSIMKSVPAAAALLLAVACNNAPSRTVTDGDEQGMEQLEHLTLQQDKDAVREAETGWWKDSMTDADERMAWYNEAKFGCFIHWGVYSQAAGIWKGKAIGGYSEHLMRKEQIPLEEYKDLVKTFNPVSFDADEWMRTVAETGMKYFIITAKHHDGFAMYPSDAYPYDIRQTGFGRDPMRELREAARKYGIKFGFYYSHAFDWEHPCAPGNDWDYDNPGGDKLLGGSDWWDGEKASFLPEAEKYVEEKSIPQIRELILNYEPDILWFDTPHKLPLYLNMKILKAIREVPGGDKIVVNGRLAHFGSRNYGDYVNSGDRAAFFFPIERKWESIPTTNESYGYSATDTLRKPASHFIRLLTTAVSKGGNILMNVGPMGNGRWDERDVAVFKEVGLWLGKYGQGIYGAEPSGLPVQPWGVTTKKNDTLYVHVYERPENGEIILGGLRSAIRRAWAVADPDVGISYKKVGRDDWKLIVPASCADASNTVLALKVSDELDVNPVRLLSSGSEVLAAFDADLHGDNLGYGDGKVNRNYVKNWTSDEQWLSWKVRLNESVTYRCSIEYNTENADDSGSVVLETPSGSFETGYSGVSGSTGSSCISVSEITFPKGESELILKGAGYKGKAYMRPIAIRLEK